MAEQITNYQCPNCTGPLRFDPTSGKLRCEYCGSSFTVEEAEQQFGAAEQKAAEAAAKASKQAQPEGSPWSDAEKAGLKVYQCPSCGAELICDATTTATSCPYCGNPSIVPGEFRGALRPEWVIPFRQTKEQAIAALKTLYRRKPLLPKLFSAQNHLEEIKGVYAPFWLYDGEADGDVSYNAQKVRHWREGQYDVTETSYYECFRSGKLPFARIPVDSSTKMPDEYMDAIEPFDYGELKAFSTAYLPGYMAEKYDVSAEDAQERARSRAERTLESVMRDTVEGYTLVGVKDSEIHFQRSGLRYALLPVWLLNTKWKDNIYLFAVNGQTGKPVGNLPVDKGRKRAWFIGVWAAVSAVALGVIALFL